MQIIAQVILKVLTASSFLLITCVYCIREIVTLSSYQDGYRAKAK